MGVNPRLLRRVAAAALAATLVLGAGAACSKKNDGAGTTGTIKLTVDTFGDFGYADLVKEYQSTHPNITVELRNVEKLDDYKPRLTQWLAAGSGAGDVVGLEEGILNEFKTQPQNFVNLLDHGAGDLKDNFLPWKWQLGLSGDGKQLLGLGTDVGGMAMCYRRDLFAKAGLPQDRDAVSKLWPTWDAYLETGRKYKGATNAAFVDSVTTAFSAIMFQEGETNFYDRENKLVADTNPVVRAAWDKVNAIAAAGVTAKLQTWSKDWEAGFKQGTFATTPCPAWMLGIIKNNAGAENAGKWDVAAVPGGGGNWGGSWLAVPKQSKHPAEAAALAKFLTSAKSHVAAFKKAGALPSSPQGLDDPGLLEFTNEYFNKAPVGKIFGAGAKALKPVHLGPKHQAVKERAFEPALQSIEQGKAKPDDAWKTAIEAAKREAK